MSSQQESFEVKLQVYDLSQGLAQQFSQALLGKQVNGIWHTGVVYQGVEYFFGQGIMKGPPGQVMPMPVLKSISLGTTSVTQDILEDFLYELSQGKFSSKSYNLLRNNCNNFSDDLCQFLVGRGIPSYITGLPQEVLNSHMGPMLMPLLQQVETQMHDLNQVQANTLQQQPQQHRNAEVSRQQKQNIIEDVKQDIKSAAHNIKKEDGNGISKQNKQLSKAEMKELISKEFQQIMARDSTLSPNNAARQALLNVQSQLKG